MNQKQTKFPVVALIPSLNPDDKLVSVVKGLFDSGFSDVLLVDDGSREECRPFFDQLSQLPGCIVLCHESNKGKGRALKTAFSYYLEHYDQECYFGVVTADADGQHLPKDIMSTAEALFSVSEHKRIPNPQTIALGTRNFDEEQVPPKSRNGNKITTAVFKLLYGKLINDTQTGLRAISNDFVQACLKISGERFEYEINMLIQAVLQKLNIVEVIIRTVYFENNRETHFHPVKDSIRIYRVMLASFLRFTCSGLFSTLVDQGLFALLQKIVLLGMDSALSISLSTLLARGCSSYLNYSLNRSFVFQSDTSNRKTLIRYYILCIVQMAASAGSVTVLHLLTRMDTSFLKLIVDILLFFISYRVQRGWVFKKGKGKC